MSEIKLKPCPFCGSDDITVGSVTTSMGTDNYVRCRSCNAKVQLCEEYGELEVVRRWNTRAPIKQIVEQLEELKNESNMLTAKCSVNIIAVSALRKAIEIVKAGRVE